MNKINKFRNIFLTLDGHNDPALNIFWIDQIKKGKIWHNKWFKKNKNIISEKINKIENNLDQNFVPVAKYSEKNRKIFYLKKEQLIKELIKLITDGKIFNDNEFASLLILLNQKYYQNLEVSYYIRLVMELVDNELIFDILCLSDLKKKKNFPHGDCNYVSDFLKYNFYKNYKKDISILKLLNFKKNRKPNKKNFCLDDCVQYKYFDKFKVYSYNHKIDYPEVQKNREIIRNELRDLWFETKWKNEEILYRNIRLLLEPKNITPIKWHKNQKLKRQHLDIYFEINRKKYGVEYQGAQHFKPVLFFGGKRGLKNRIRLDRLKRSRCTRAKITLITFNYNEPIDKQAIAKKFKDYGLNVLKERRMYV